MSLEVVLAPKSCRYQFIVGCGPRPLIAMATTPPGTALANGGGHVMRHLTYLVVRTRRFAVLPLSTFGGNVYIVTQGPVGGITGALVWFCKLHTNGSCPAFHFLAPDAIVGVVYVVVGVASAVYDVLGSVAMAMATVVTRTIVTIQATIVTNLATIVTNLATIVSNLATIVSILATIVSIPAATTVSILVTTVVISHNNTQQYKHTHHLLHHYE